MYDRLGIHWASTIPACLALACVPAPFLFYKYGAVIRKKCKYASISEDFVRRTMAEMKQDQDNNSDGDTNDDVSTPHDSDSTKKETEKEFERHEDAEDRRIEEYEEEQDRTPRVPPKPITRKTDPRRLALTQTLSRQHTHESYNPFDIDRVNTKDSFPGENRVREKRPASSRTSSRR